MNTVLIKPLITERSLKEAQTGRYTFVVAKAANKGEIRRAVEKQFKVQVTGVFTSMIKGSRTRFTRLGKRTTDITYKKARVTLGKDQKIPVFEEQIEGSKPKKDK